MDPFTLSLKQRVEAFGGQPGDFNFAADILRIIALQSEGWTHRRDDAIRIPDMIYERARCLAEYAKDIATTSVDNSGEGE